MVDAATVGSTWSQNDYREDLREPELSDLAGSQTSSCSPAAGAFPPKPAAAQMIDAHLWQLIKSINRKIPWKIDVNIMHEKQK